MSELTDSDAELAYKYLPERARGDVEHAAYDAALSRWRAERPDDLDALEDAADDADSDFAWEGLTLEFEQRDVDGDEELVPLAGVEPGAERDVYDLAHDFGWAYVEAIREQVRECQAATNFSPREFVAFVLSESRLSWEEAASEMGIASGTFASKMQREVTPEIQRARETIAFVERFENDA